MTARTPYQAGGGDVSATLGELERKLRELEQELNATARPDNGGPAATSATPAAPAPATPPPAPVAPAAAAPAAPSGRDADALIAQARARLGTLDGQVDELLRFREQLHRTARELEDEYSRVLARIGAPAAPPPGPAPPAAPTAAPSAAQPDPAAAPAPAPPYPGAVRVPIAPPIDEATLLPNHPAFAMPDQTLASPVVEPPPGVAPVAPAAPEPDPVAAAAPPPVPVAAPAVPAAAPPPPAHEDTLFEGAIVLDAGPFTDIATLSAFEQGLARVRGAEDVYVSGFEGNRALVELRLSQPVALVQEMRAAVPATFTVTDAAAGRLRLDVTAITPGS